MYFSKLKPFIYLGLFYGIVSLLARIIFIFHPITTVEFGLFESLKILLVGALSDIFVFILSASILAVYFLFLSEGKYKNPYGYIIFALFALAFVYTAFLPGNIFRQYGGSFPEVAMIFVGLKTFLFGLMLHFAHNNHCQLFVLCLNKFYVSNCFHNCQLNLGQYFWKALIAKVQMLY